VVLLAFLNVTGMVAFATPEVAAYDASGAETSFWVGVLGFFVSVFSLVTFMIIRVSIKALGAIEFLFTLIPGTHVATQVVRYLVAALYIVLAFLSPEIAAVIGVMILTAAALTFRQARRIDIYFKRIYIYPFWRSIFARKKEWPLVMAKTPKSLQKKFPNMVFCQEAFVMRGLKKLPRRQRVFLVTAEGATKLCRRVLLAKWQIIDFDMSRLNIEPKFRFVRIYDKTIICKKCYKVVSESFDFCVQCGAKTKTARPYIELVLRRELKKRLEEIDLLLKNQGVQPL